MGIFFLFKQAACYTKNTIKESDLYAEKISLKFQGNDKIPTIYGGFITFLIKWALFINAMTLVLVIFKKEDTKKSINKVVKDLIYDETKHYVAQGTFALAIGYVDYVGNELSSDILLDPSYFSLYFAKIHSIREENGTITSTHEPLDYKICGNDYPLEDASLYSLMGLDKYVWLTRDDYYLKSEYNGKTSTYLTVFVNKWVNTTENGNICKSDSEIQVIWDRGYLNIASMSAYFDFNDYVTPIKKYLSALDIVSFPSNNLASQTVEMRIQENEAITSDNIFFSTGTTQTKYYAVKEVRFQMVNPSITQGAMINVIVALSRESEVYERAVYSFFDMFGYLGGLFDFWYFWGFLWVSYFNKKYKNVELISTLYQIEERPIQKDREVDYTHKMKSLMVTPKPTLREFSKLESNKSGEMTENVNISKPNNQYKSQNLTNDQIVSD